MASRSPRRRLSPPGYHAAVGASCEHPDARERVRAPDVHSQRADVSSDDAGAAQTTTPLRSACSRQRRARSQPSSTPTGWNRLAPPSSVEKDARATNAAKRARKRDHVNPVRPLPCGLRVLVRAGRPLPIHPPRRPARARAARPPPEAHPTDTGSVPRVPALDALPIVICTGC
jgi:hypothetical protein